jgi:D-alanyl-D-alanine carboxypeptidase
VWIAQRSRQIDRRRFVASILWGGLMALSLGAIASRRIKRLFGGLCVAAVACAALTSSADARGWRYSGSYRVARYHAAHYHHVRHYWAYRAPAYSPPFSAMVVDANSGRTLYAAAENELRHPASITKVMTLYLLFEQLDKGRMTLDTPIEVSAHAASQAPSKLGLEPGDSLSTDDAIKAVVTRSANDIAVAIAEKIGGDEANFAEMMTRKAHALGMTHTVYVNASGLPDDRQITTARDLTILAQAVQERFPRYFHYFSTHSFEFAGETIGNHNHLLGRVDGVDGIKTGYTNASGFNLMTSMHRDGRSLVAVVMGGRSAGARDALMEQLLYQHFAQASAGARTAPMIAEASETEPMHVAEVERPRGGAMPTPLPPARGAGLAKADMEAESQAEGDDDENAAAPIRSIAPPREVAKPTPAPAVIPVQKTADQAQPGKPIELAPMGSAYAPAPAPAPAIAALPLHQIASVVKPEPLVAKPVQAAAPRPTDPAALGWVKGPEAVARTAEATPPARPEALLKQAMLQAAHPVEETRIAKSEDPRPATRDGWKIQIAATDDADKANDMLSRARAENHASLALAKPFTEKVQRGDATLYRARFAVLDETTAETACRSLKRTGFSCFATRD